MLLLREGGREGWRGSKADYPQISVGRVEALLRAIQLKPRHPSQKKKIEHSPACTGLVISGREVQERQQDDVPATSLHSSARGNK